MSINACVKNMRTNSLPQIQSPVALLFLDKGGLANHPLSCHPQGVFGRQENERKFEKMREKESSGKPLAQALSIICRMEKVPSYKSLTELI